MENVNATNFRKNIFEYLNSAVSFGDVINISTKNGNAIVISEDEYNSLVETVYLLSIPGMKEKLIDGKKASLDDCQALKDKEKIKGNKALESKVKNLIELISKNPYESPPSFEKLKGDLDGLISRRINIQHRLVYEVYEEEKVVKIISMWTHYENL